MIERARRIRVPASSAFDIAQDSEAGTGLVRRCNKLGFAILRRGTGRISCNEPWRGHSGVANHIVDVRNLRADTRCDQRLGYVIAGRGIETASPNAFDLGGIDSPPLQRPCESIAHRAVLCPVWSVQHGKWLELEVLAYRFWREKHGHNRFRASVGRERLINFIQPHADDQPRFLVEPSTDSIEPCIDMHQIRTLIDNPHRH